MSKKLRELKIDDDLKILFIPIPKTVLKELERKMKKEGCTEPVYVWNGQIIDGAERYKICVRNDIDFPLERLDFGIREEAVAWICRRQLERENLPEAARRFLIGILYDSEKIINSMKRRQSQEAHPSNKTIYESSMGHRTAVRIAEEYHISWNTVNKYAIYARALEDIAEKVPEFATKVLEGFIKISHDDIVELSSQTDGRIAKEMARFESSRLPLKQYTSNRTSEENRDYFDGPSVKDMPQFDPDAEITSLSYTIPSWVETIRRVGKNTDFSATTEKSRMRLNDALFRLWEAADNLLSEMGKY